jgi:hypothetical protein
MSQAAAIVSHHNALVRSSAVVSIALLRQYMEVAWKSTSDASFSGKWGSAAERNNISILCEILNEDLGTQSVWKNKPHSQMRGCFYMHTSDSITQT